MMTPSRLAAAGDPAASEGNLFDFTAASPTSSPDSTREDFSRLMSQAGLQHSSQQPVSRQPAAKTSNASSQPGDATTKPKSAQKNDSYLHHLAAVSSNYQRPDATVATKPASDPAASTESSDVTSDTQHATRNTDTDDTTATSGSTPTDTATPISTNLDPSLASTLMAMLAQAVVKPSDLRKPAISDTQHETSNAETTALTGDSTPKKDISATSPTDTNPTTTEAIAGSVAITKGMKLASGSIHPPPADISGSTPASIAKSLDPTTSTPQPIVGQQSSAPTDSLISVAPPDGTSAALDKSRMKFVAQKNEIAGRTGQKLPSASASDDVATDLAVKHVNAVASELSNREKDSFDPSVTLDWANKPAVFSVEQGTMPAVQPADNSAVQAERVAHLVNQEVIMVRQSGANNLAVSLKLDAHTELSLQLSQHNGQIQASLRCERGNVEGLGQHWGDLQASLAKQNVQLLPLENNGSSRNSTFNPPSNGANDSSFQQPSQNPQRQSRNLPQDLIAPVTTVKTVSATTKTKIASPQGWEALA